MAEQTLSPENSPKHSQAFLKFIKTKQSQVEVIMEADEKRNGALVWADSPRHSQPEGTVTWEGKFPQRKAWTHTGAFCLLLWRAPESHEHPFTWCSVSYTLPFTRESKVLIWCLPLWSGQRGQGTVSGPVTGAPESVLSRQKGVTWNQLQRTARSGHWHPVTNLLL